MRPKKIKSTSPLERGKEEKRTRRNDAVKH